MNADTEQTRPATPREQRTNLAHFEEALRITKTGKDGKGNSYTGIGALNQAAWIGEHSGVLIDEIKMLRAQVDELEPELTTVRLALAEQRAQAQAELDQVNEELAGARAELGRTHEMWKSAADELLRTRDVVRALAEALKESQQALQYYRQCIYADPNNVQVDVAALTCDSGIRANDAIENARAALEKAETL